VPLKTKNEGDSACAGTLIDALVTPLLVSSIATDPARHRRVRIFTCVGLM